MVPPRQAICRVPAEAKDERGCGVGGIEARFFAADHRPSQSENNKRKSQGEKKTFLLWTASRGGSSLTGEMLVA
jgi:hypothetical protein